MEWWTGIPVAATTLECGGHSHTLRWEQGVLTAVDHTDIAAEATLAALARESVPCLDRVRAWNRHSDDVHALVLASRGIADRLDVATDRHTHPRAPIKQGDDAELLELLALGGGLPDRLQAHVAAAWTDRLRSGHPDLDAARPQLRAALYGRVLAALRVWLGEPQLAIELTMADPGGARLLARDGEKIAVGLPFSWLTEVWARGLATIVGRLCLEARTDDGVSWSLDTVEPDLATIAELLIIAP